MGSPDAFPKPSEPAASAHDQQDRWIGVDGSDGSVRADELLESCRAYLLFVANRELDAGLRGKIAPSDVVQETFVDAEKKLTGFRGTSREQLQAWLRRILLNNLTDARRRFYDAEKRSIEREQPFDGDSRVQQPAVDVAADVLSPRASMIASEETAVMREALKRLSGDYRKVVELRSLKQLSFPEVARQLDRSENATRKLWSRAIVRLQEELSTLDGDTAR